MVNLEDLGLGYYDLDFNQHPFGGTNTRILLWNQHLLELEPKLKPWSCAQVPLFLGQQVELFEKLASRLNFINTQD